MAVAGRDDDARLSRFHLEVVVLTDHFPTAAAAIAWLLDAELLIENGDGSYRPANRPVRQYELMQYVLALVTLARDPTVTFGMLNEYEFYIEVKS